MALPDIAGFQGLESVYGSARTHVLRAVRVADGRRVVFKGIAAGRGDARGLARLEQEFRILKDLRVEGVVVAYALHQTPLGTLLELDDGGPITLFDHARAAMDIGAFVEVAQRIAAAVANLHNAGVVHRDLTPSNIAFEPATGAVRLIDFDIASRLPRESLQGTPIGQLEGTPGYLSPEQTGRMNRPIDRRSDLYTLGATFYRLLTGRPPFTARDGLETVHATVAVVPTPVISLRPDVPPILNAIVMRLLSKMAEDRYQTADGLSEDLRRVGAHLRAGTEPRFTLGQADRWRGFALPERLYGRGAAVERLEDGLDRARSGEPVAVAVLGEAGIGKTATVMEIDRKLTEAGGWLVSAKFDQLRRPQPYAVLAGAMRELIRRVLAGGATEVESWRARLQAALGANAAIVTELVADVALVLGHQPTVHSLPPAEARLRQHLVIRAFLRVFHSPEHPLVLFLDDMQWADLGSLGLIESLLTDWQGTPPMLILAWRAEDVDALHPLRGLLDRLPAAVFRRVTLGPMEEGDITELIVDALSCRHRDAAALSGLVMRKTGGNAFFVRAFLSALHQRDLLVYRPGQGWTWDLAAVDAMPVTTNVVDLLARRLGELPADTARNLSLAACIGNRFDLSTLMVAGSDSVAAVAGALAPAVEAGLIEPVGDSWNALQRHEPSARFRFAHDRVQEAAYERMPERERAQTHLGVGRLLLKESGPGELGDTVFDVVGQFNRGQGLIVDPRERIAVAELNLTAARRARGSAAFEAGLDHLEAGIRLLAADSWARHYPLAFALYRDAAEAAVLTPGRTPPGYFLDAAGPHAATTLDRVALHEVRVRDHLARNENPEALRCALEALKWLGMDLPLKPNRAQVGFELLRTKLALRGHTLESLRALPAATDAESVAIYRLIAFTAAPAYYASGLLLPVLFCRLVRETLTRGVHARCGYGFVGYALLLAAFFDDLAGAQLYGQLAHDIVERFDAPGEYSSVQVTWLAFVHARSTPYAALVPRFEASQHGCIAGGDAERAAQSSLGIMTYAFHAGRPLAELAERAERETDLCKKIGQQRPLRSVQLIGQMVSNLRGRGSEPWKIDGELVSRSRFLEAGERTKDLSSLACLHIYEGMLAMWFGRLDEARSALTSASVFLENVPGANEVEIYHWYDALLALAEARQGKTLARRTVDKALRRLMKRTSENASNFEHKLRLLEAEVASFEARDADAVLAFDTAIRLAWAADQRGEYAYAFELAARHFARRGQYRSAVAYFTEARKAWFDWGAVAREATLEQFAVELRQFEPGLLSPLISQPVDAPTGAGASSLDLESVLKTARILSRELDLNELLRQLLAVVVENAGADGGFLALEQGGGLAASARATAGEVTVERGGGADTVGTMAHALPLMNYVARTRQTVVVEDCARDNTFFRSVDLRPGTESGRAPRSAMAVPLVNGSRLVGVMYLENSLATGVFTAARTEVVGILASQAAISVENARLYESLRESLERQTRLTLAYERFMPRQFLEQLEKHSIFDVDLGDQVQREISVLFADIRGFTTMCEQLGPARTFAFVNSYLHWIEPAIHGHGGYVNAFLGDGIMALYPTSADDALHSALAMLAAVDEYNRVRERAGEPPMKIGIGLNTGSLMVGVIGGHDRMDRGVIGDAANVASRVEGMTKQYGATLLTTGGTISRLRDPSRFTIRAVDRVIPVGRAEPLTIYEVLDGEPEARREGKRATRGTFARGLDHWGAGEIEQALACYRECAEVCPEDAAAVLFIDRCEERLAVVSRVGRSSDAEPFDAVTRLTQK